MKASFVFAAALAASLSQADLTSTFDVDNEGWMAADVSTTDLSIQSSAPTTWNAGHIEAMEFGNAFFVLSAPSAYLGDLSGYYGGTTSFTLSDTVRDGLAYPNLLIRGNGFAMAYVTPPPASLPGTSYTIPMTESGWIDFNQRPVSRTAFLNALSNVDEFGVSADWATLRRDSVTLDNVRVAAVPEPSTLAALGLGLCAALRRRRLRVS